MHVVPRGLLSARPGTSRRKPEAPRAAAHLAPGQEGGRRVLGVSFHPQRQSGVRSVLKKRHRRACPGGGGRAPSPGARALAGPSQPAKPPTPRGAPGRSAYGVAEGRSSSRETPRRLAPSWRVPRRHPGILFLQVWRLSNGLSGDVKAVTRG